MVYIFFVKHLVFGPQILCSIICFLCEYLMRFDKKKLSQPESKMNLIKSTLVNIKDKLKKHIKLCVFLWKFVFSNKVLKSVLVKLKKLSKTKTKPTLKHD